MDGDILKVVVAALLMSGAAVVLLMSVVFRASGTWIRDVSLTNKNEDDGSRETRRRERIVLSSLGPFVSGRSDDVGGHHEFSGFQIARTLYLTRRDHGVKMLMQNGYPEPIAKRQDGEIAARLTLRLVDGTHLVGDFVGQRIEFTHQPPRVTAVVPMKTEQRRYRRVAGAEVDEMMPVVDFMGEGG